MTLSAADRHGLRGLLMRVRAQTRPPTARHLVTSYYGSGAPGGDKRGTCRWCGEPCKRAYAWHSDNDAGDTCLDWYFAAKGQVEMFSPGRRQTLNWAKARCVECGSQEHTEVDHQLAICVARELYRLDPDCRWWLAWTPLNLRPLCHEHHRVKTRRDRAFAKALAAYRETGQVVDGIRLTGWAFASERQPDLLGLGL